jgi:Uma2 family endonuclease
MSSAAISMPSPYRLSVKQYHRMIETDVLTEDDRVELLEGVISPKMTHKPPHDCAVSLVQDSCQPLLPKGWIIRIQSAVTTADSEPEPDVAMVRGPARRYLSAHPGPKDIACLVEVADSTLFQDRNVKGRLYARARIPVYWVINLVDRHVEVYTRPRAGKDPAYQVRHDYAPKDDVPIVIEGRIVGHIPARDLLP